MTRAMIVAAVVGLAVSPLMAAADKTTVTGEYVEARTAEVFTGGCIMGSEAHTTGNEAILAWKVDRGAFNGVSLEGLSVVAAVVGDKNLGIWELGGDRATTRSAVMVDERANPAQRMALVAMAHELSKGVVGEIVRVTPAPIKFADFGSEIQVTTEDVALSVNKHMPHDPGCGAMQWFHPLSSVEQAEIGLADQHSFTGPGLGAKWSAPNRRSAFFGTFAY
jgi:hypothetical protein